MYQTIINSPITQVVGIVLLLSYFHLAGIIEGILWSTKGADATKRDEHDWLTASRVVIFFLCLIPLNPLFTIATFFLFPLIHNGAYYQARKNISGGKTYPKGWRSEPSKTSTASINFSYKQRLILGAVGLIGIFLTAIFL